MKKSFFGLIILFVLLTTYSPKTDLIKNFNLNIKKIIIEDTSIVDQNEIKKKLNFLYEENLFFLDTRNIEILLKSETFIESFIIKKIYPSTLKLLILEKKPIAILQLKKKKFYISNKGDLINFIDIDKYKNLPIVFGNGKTFYSLYKDLEDIRFPIQTIKSFYFFDSGRWDLITIDDKIIKLPIKDYLESLKNFMKSKNNSNFNNYKIFDYRIKDQLIIN